MTDANKNDTADYEIIIIGTDKEKEDANSDSVQYKSICDCNKITMLGGSFNCG